MKKSLRIGLLGLLTGTTALAGALTLNAQKNGVVSADTNFTMEMEDGAAVRLVGTDEKEYGIKYTAKLATYDTDAKYYVMIIPTGWLNTYDLSKTYDATCDYYGTLSQEAAIADRIMTMEATPQYVEADGCYYFEGSIKTVKYENSFREYFGVAYMEKNGERTYAEFDEGENIRSVSQVASAALNDKTAGWTDTQKASLKKMVQTAYNAANDNDYTTVETAELPTISAESDELSLLSGDTRQIDTLTGVPANIGVQVQYTSSSPAQVTVSESGLLTANTVGSGATITATVLGEDYEVAKVAPVENMLVGFDTEESEDNIVKITNGADYQNSESDDVFAVEWKESFEGRNGVVKTVTTSGGDYGQHRVYPLFNTTKTYMTALDFDYISIWIYVDAEGTYNARSYNYVLNEVEGKKWQEIRITAEDIVHEEQYKNSYWVQNWGANARNQFNTVYAQKDSSITELFQLNNGVKNAAPITVYLDSISYACFNDDAFVAPTQAGEFTLPAVSMGDKQAKNVNVTNGTDSLTVAGGKTELPYSGDYTVEYAYSYNGLAYTKDFSFTVSRAAMAANMLEDFNDPTSVNNIGYGALGNGEWLESFTVGGVEKKGVVTFTTTGSDPGNLIYARFNRTSEELLALDFDYISFNFFAYKPNNLSDRWVTLTVCGVSKGYNRPEATTLETVFSKGAWKEVQITKDELVSYAQSNTRYSNLNTGSDLGNLFAVHDKNGTGRYLLSSSTTVETFYFDSITFGKNA